MNMASRLETRIFFIVIREAPFLTVDRVGLFDVRPKPDAATLMPQIYKVNRQPLKTSRTGAIKSRTSSAA